MKKNPLLVLLGISAAFFICFMIFVFFILQSFVEDGDSPLLALKSGGRVGVVEVEGVIMESKKIIKQLKKFGDDSGIKGIVLRINSPGGAVAPGQEIHDAIIKLREKKPVVASMGSVAASGGYYIAVAADKIVANPGTITGSIGVIMEFMNMEDLMAWAKMRRFNIKSGKYKDIGSAYKEMSEEERQLLQEMIDSVHMQFMQAVAKGREQGLGRIKQLAQGQIYSGEQAHKLKLVDTLGGLQAAVEEVKLLANMEGDPELVYPKEKRRGIWGALDGPFEDLLQIMLPERLQNLLQQRPVPPAARRGLLYLAPGL